MVAWPEDLGDLAAGQQRTDRHASAKALGQRDDVRTDSVVLESHPASRATDTGLHLVEHQQRPYPGRQLAQSGQVVALGRDHAALSLDRLDEDGAGVGTDGRLDRLEIVERNEAETGGQRLELLPVPRHAGGREGAQGPAVKAALGHDDLGHRRAPSKAPPLPGQLDRGLDRLRTAVAEEGPVESAHLLQESGGFGLLGDVVEVRDVQVALGLLADRALQRRVSMSKRRDRDAADEVQVLRSVETPEVGAASVGEGDRLARVVAEEVFLRGRDRRLDPWGWVSVVSGRVSNRPAGAAPHHRADAAIGEKLDEEAVRIAGADDVGALHPAFDRGEARLELGDHAPRDFPGLEHRAGGWQIQLRYEPALAALRAQNPVHVRQQDELLGVERHGQRRSGVVGVEVVGGPGPIGADRGDDGHEAAFDHRLQHVGSHSLHLSDVAQAAGRRMRPGDQQASVFARESGGPTPGGLDPGHEPAVDPPRQNHLHDLHRVGVRHAEAVDEPRRVPEAVQHPADLDPAPVYEHGLQTGALQEDDVLQGCVARLIQNASPELDDHRLAAPAGRVAQRLGQGEADGAPCPLLEVGGRAARLRDSGLHETMPASAA